MTRPLASPPHGPARILHDDTVLAEGLAALAGLDPVMEELIAIRPPYMRTRPPGFASLVATIVGQQVSVASAEAINARVAAHFGKVTAQAIAAADEASLRACGLSGPKIRALRSVAEAVLEGRLPLDALAAMPAEEAKALMTAVKGIGPWTADIYLLFCLGHADAFAAGDLALQEAARILYGMAARPTAKELDAFALRWRPWRGVASKVLWAHYLDAKGRERVPLGN